MLIASIGYMFGYRLARFPVRWLRRRLDTALLLRSVRIMMAGGKAMPDIFLFLAERFPAARFRRRLERAVVDVETGVDWNQSLLEHRLSRRSDAAVLAAAAAARARQLPQQHAEQRVALGVARVRRVHPARIDGG